ncbi:MAG: hypothetical protein ABR508_01105 [Candidatus Baltobacteraceae bacterium]
MTVYDPVDERGVPTTRGVPRAVLIAVLVGVLVIFAIGADTIALAGYGHAWPSTKTLRIPVNGSYRP